MGKLNDIEIKLNTGKIVEAARLANGLDERISFAKGKIASLSVQMANIVTKATRLETELKAATKTGNIQTAKQTINDIQDDIPPMEVSITLLKRALDDLK